MEAGSVAAPFLRAAAEIFREMLDLEITSGSQEQEGEIFSSLGFTVIVGMTGGWQGRLLMDMSGQTACRLAEIITGDTCDSPSADDVLLSGAELGNIIGGRAITAVNNSQPGLNIRLTPPTVFTGDSTVFFNARTGSWSTVVQTDAGIIKLNVAVEGVKQG